MSEPTFCTEAAPPLDETEALAAISLAFGLRHNEAQVLLSLMTHGFRTLEQLRAVTNHSAETSTISVTIHTMRKKLKPRGIEVVNVAKLGYALRKESRDRIRRLLAKNDDVLTSGTAVRAPP